MRILKTPTLLIRLFFDTGTFRSLSKQIAATALAFAFLLNPHWVLAQNQLSLDDLMAMPLNALMDVTITSATHSPERIADLPASIVIITKQEIIGLGYESLGEILRTIPGVYSIDDYNYIYNFGVRGFWTDSPNRHMPIMINGVRRSANYTDDNDLRYLNIPPEAIERIEVIRGPNTLIHGSGAFFGIINIVTVPEAPVHRSQFQITLGSRSTRRFVATANHVESDWSLNAHAAFVSSNGIDIPYADLGSSQPGSLKKHLDKQHINFNLHGQYGPLTCQFYFAENRDDDIFLIPAIEAGTLGDNPIVSLSAIHQQSWGNAWSTRFVLNFSRVTESYEFHVLYPDFWGLQKITSSGYRYSGEANYRPHSGFTLSAGIDGQYIYSTLNDYDLPGFGQLDLEHMRQGLHPDDAIQSQAAYLRLQARIAPRLHLAVGARLERQQPYRIQSRQAVALDSTYTLREEIFSCDNSDWHFVPQLSLIFQPAETWSIKMLYGKAISHPSIFQNLGQERTIHSTSMKSEWIETYELAILYEPRPSISLSASLFSSRLDDLILRSTGFYPSGEYYNFFDNIGHMRTQGGELQLTVKPHPSLKLEFSAATQTLENRDASLDPVGYIPHWLFYGKGHWQVSRHLTLGLSMIRVDAMDPGWDAAMGRIGERAPGYTLLGFNIRYIPPFAKRWYGQIHIANLLDQEIRYPTTTNSGWAPKGTRGEPRTILLSLGVNL